MNSVRRGPPAGGPLLIIRRSFKTPPGKKIRGSALAAAAIAIATLIAGCSSPEPSQQATLTRISQQGNSPFAGCVTTDQPVGSFANESGEVEPAMAVDPNDPNRIAIAWQQDRWFDGASRGIVVAVTSDGGGTWKASHETKLSLCSGGTRANGGGHPRVTDPWLSFSPDGTLHLTALSVALDARASSGADPEAVLATRSSDGLTWSDPVALVRDEDPAVYNDKPSVTADPHDAEVAYAVWHRLSDTAPFSLQGDTRFARTSDGGVTWGPPRTILGPIEEGQSFGNEIVVLPQESPFPGRLVNLFTLISWGNDSKTEEMSIGAISSNDGGRTWSKPAVISTLETAPVTDPWSGQELKTGRLLPRVAVDPISGTVYVAWSDSSFGAGGYNDVALSISTDGGDSWSDPVRVNRTPANEAEPNRQTFTPEITATTDRGVAVAYYDLRNNESDGRPGARLDTDLFLVRCLETSPAESDGCAGEWSETRVTEGSFDLRAAPDSGGPFLGDYIGLASAGHDVIVAFPQAGDPDDPSSIYAALLGDRSN